MRIVPYHCPHCGTYGRNWEPAWCEEAYSYCRECGYTDNPNPQPQTPIELEPLPATRRGVYLLHFERPYLSRRDQRLKTAQHYLGWAVNIDHRIEQHLTGRGSPLVAAAVRAGISVELVRTWPGEDYYLEKRLKRLHNSRCLCPVCLPAYSADRIIRMADYRAARKAAA